MYKNKILPIIKFILLLIGMSIFPYIPISLFNIDYNSFNLTMKSIYMTFCNIGYILIVYLLYKEKIKKDFKNYFKKFSKNFEYSFKYYFIGLLLMLISNIIITLFIPTAIAGNEEAVREMIDNVPLYMIFSVSIYAPFIEEITFRHSIKECFKDYKNIKFKKYAYILTSGILFAAAHIIGQTTSIIDYIYIIPYLALSISFASLYEKTDNIFSSITMHCLHNTLTIILYFLAGGAI